MFSQLEPRKWLVQIFGAITVEPAMLIIAISMGLYSIVSAELYITKVCKVNLAFGNEICDNIQQHKEEQVQVQQYASTLKIYNNLLQSLPSMIFTLFAGPWSDTNGRKFLMVFSLFGFVFNNSVFMINTYWFYELKAEYLLFECLQDCTGGFTCFFMAINAYMVDITTEKNRTKRMAFLSGLWPIGFNIGKGMSGLVKERLGFMYNFGLGMSLSLVAMTYVMIFVKDSVNAPKDSTFCAEKDKDKLDPTEKKDGNSNVESLETTKPSRFKSLFDINNVKQGFNALFLKRDNNMRMFIILIVLCQQFEMFTSNSKWNVEYLYLRRQFKFTMTDYTLYTTIVGIIGIVAQYITVPLMSERFNLRDSTIILIDIAGCFFQAVIMAAANAGWMLYIGAGIAFLDATSFSMLRCLISKNVASDEVGKLFSVGSAIQSFIPIIATPVFLGIYKATLEVLPQTYLIFLSLLFAINWAILLFIDRGMRKVAITKEINDVSVESKD